MEFDNNVAQTKELLGGLSFKVGQNAPGADGSMGGRFFNNVEMKGPVINAGGQTYGSQSQTYGNNHP